MKKTKAWRASRLRVKREKERLRKQTKPDREGGHSEDGITQDRPGFNIFALLSKPIPKRKKRKKRGKAGSCQE